MVRIKIVKGLWDQRIGSNLAHFNNSVNTTDLVSHLIFTRLQRLRFISMENLNDAVFVSISCFAISPQQYIVLLCFNCSLLDNIVNLSP
jgi:hypothetical protein